MLQQSNDKRVKFQPGEQSRFLVHVINKLCITQTTLATIAGISVRRISDWKAEKSTMPLSVVNLLSKKSGLNLPNGIHYIDRYAHTRAAGKKGGKATIQKYHGFPDPNRRRLSAWKKWWEESGREKTIIASTKPARIPNDSSYLAEFTGIMMGDGGISKYQICVTLNKIDDYDYSLFVRKLMNNLFQVAPSVIKKIHEKTLILNISRLQLVRFCNDHLNLPTGHKIRHGLYVPGWIMKKTVYKRSFLRGLFDTDGCVVIEKHKVDKVVYSYARLNFTSYCPILSKSTFQMLTELGYTPKVRRNERSIQLENYDEICDYFRVIGTHNPKHTERLKKVGIFRS